jgi:hypothetical protein
MSFIVNTKSPMHTPQNAKKLEKIKKKSNFIYKVLSKRKVRTT